MQPLQWVRSFEATARCGSETRAAQELGLTQATVSQHIKALEGRLRIQLFERTTRGMILTGAGSELYVAIAEGIGHIEAALGRFGMKDEGRLHILCNTSLAASWLVPRLHEFRQANPEIELRLSTALWQTDAIGVQADVSLYLGPGKQGGDREIPGGALMLLAPPGERELAPLIRVTGFETDFESFRRSGGLTQAGGGRDRPSLECDSFHSALQLAADGLGVAFAPRLAAADLVRQGRLCVIGSWDHHAATGYWSRILTPRLRAATTFQDWAIEAAARALAA